MPEIPDEIKKKIMDFLEKVAKAFPESELEKSLPCIKSDLDTKNLVILSEITLLLMKFFLKQGEKKEQPDIKIKQIEELVLEWKDIITSLEKSIS